MSHTRILLEKKKKRKETASTKEKKRLEAIQSRKTAT